MNILLCEPSAVWREEFYKVFRKRGWKVATAHEPSMIIKLLEANKYEALVCNRALLPAANAIIPGKLVLLSNEEMKDYPCVLLLSSDPFQSAKQAAVFLAK